METRAGRRVHCRGGQILQRGFARRPVTSLMVPCPHAEDRDAMTETPADVVESVEPPRRSHRHWRRWAVIIGVLLLLFGVPWWTLLASGAAWPTVVFLGG